MKKEFWKSYAVITLGCALYALAFDWFYAPNDLTCGGFTGVAQIIHFFAPSLPVGVLILALNVPLYLLGLRRFGLGFLAKSLYATALSSVLMDAIAALHTFSPLDPLLACLYGGVLLGASGGVMMREEATTGGTELASWLVKPHVPQLSLGSVLLGLDLAVIFCYAAAFGNLNNALYGGVALFVTTKVIDLLVYGGNTGKLTFIVSERQEELAERLLELGMGVTRLDGTGAFTKSARPVLLCAVRRREIVLVRRTVKETDPDAFFIMCDASEVLGEGFGEYKPNGVQ